MKVLVIPDKFKGTLTAGTAAQAMAKGWRQARPGDELTLLPMSDGGDGFGEVVGCLLGAKERRVSTEDAAHRPVEAGWWWVDYTRTAIIETARIIGLSLLPSGQYHPFELDTRGVAAVLRAAEAAGARHCIIGIGGSATNDAGFGLARGLGWVFLDHQGGEITQWTRLDEAVEVVPPRHPVTSGSMTVAVDVRNRLLGLRGATRIYGPQKGLKPEDFERAEACFKRLRSLMKQLKGCDHAVEPGSGAAGGLGFGLRAFCNAGLEPGFALFARLANLEERLRGFDAVLTGEGSIDASSLMGKGVGEVARMSRQAGIPCYGLAGVTDGKAGRFFTRVEALTPHLTTPEDARSRAAWWLERLACEVAESV